MDIPTRIKIGAHWYKILFVPQVDEEGSFGEVSDADCEIRILASLTPSQMEETLIHEILHALGPSLEEHEVDRLGFGLHQVLVDNQLLK
jgi:hypothetical protein